ncbi:hypothetical protein LXM25_06355 [Dyadobacter sp. LJ53]|uniref:hypothetical protein n=1 Tax=Dyadobacter chenwenxiniae TaxID=2906456 RepID=UPI001F38D1B0|nr:hypothetical protein [Dyadobacter chenwenxiniae]MCF0049666.1 hypothetical protein [Dyadobacter chenwenxiniae]
MENPMPRISYGFVNAEVNGSLLWNKTYENAYQGTYALDETNGAPNPCDRSTFLCSELYNENSYLRQSFLLYKFPLQKGRYKILPYEYNKCNEKEPVCANFYTWTSDGDVLGDNYKVLTNANNFLEIESYDSKTKELKASFEVTFVLESQGSSHVLKDTLHFKNGKIHTKIIPKRKR